MSYIVRVALGIKTRFEPPAPMTSPLEAYCAIGTIARAVKLGLPEQEDTLFEMRDQLGVDTGNNEPGDSRIAKTRAILKGFIRNKDTTDQMVGYVTYGYENEGWHEWEMK